MIHMKGNMLKLSKLKYKAASNTNKQAKWAQQISASLYTAHTYSINAWLKQC